MNDVMKYSYGVDRASMEEELFRACHNKVHETLPTIFYFEGCADYKLFSFYFASKLAKEIHRNLFVFRENGWNAVVFIDEVGFTHVFFGKNEGIIEMPDVYNLAVAGSC